ncbi:hypothetical protein AGMMS49592_0290 [Endomicrobiia bacterium]|nr:hypothetical protein AGMMS49592_0290 [Endomicrobiia bacterium]
MPRNAQTGECTLAIDINYKVEVQGDIIAYNRDVMANIIDIYDILNQMLSMDSLHKPINPFSANNKKIIDLIDGHLIGDATTFGQFDASRARYGIDTSAPGATQLEVTIPDLINSVGGIPNGYVFKVYKTNEGGAGNYTIRINGVNTQQLYSFDGYMNFPAGLFRAGSVYTIIKLANRFVVQMHCKVVNDEAQLRDYTYNTIAPRVVSLETKVTALEGRCDLIEDRLDVNEGDIRDLRLEMEEMNTDLNERCDTLQTEINTINSTIISLNSLQPIGTIAIWSSNDPYPQGWLGCQADSPVEVNDYSQGYINSNGKYKDLANVIGTTYGVGSDPRWYKLPDFRGLFAKGSADVDGVVTEASLMNHVHKMVNSGYVSDAYSGKGTEGDIGINEYSTIASGNHSKSTAFWGANFVSDYGLKRWPNDGANATHGRSGPPTTTNEADHTEHIRLSDGGEPNNIKMKYMIKALDVE